MLPPAMQGISQHNQMQPSHQLTGKAAQAAWPPPAAARSPRPEVSSGLPLKMCNGVLDSWLFDATGGLR